MITINVIDWGTFNGRTWAKVRFFCDKWEPKSHTQDVKIGLPEIGGDAIDIPDSALRKALGWQP